MKTFTLEIHDSWGRAGTLQLLTEEQARARELAVLLLGRSPDRQRIVISEDGDPLFALSRDDLPSPATVTILRPDAGAAAGGGLAAS